MRAQFAVATVAVALSSGSFASERANASEPRLHGVGATRAFSAPSRAFVGGVFDDGVFDSGAFDGGIFDNGVRGVTVGPIESTLHSGRGYGTQASAESLDQVSRLGGNWVSFTPFGRGWKLAPSGVDRNFEAGFEANRTAVRGAISQAHARGLRVMLVPHLWLEGGGWRGEIDFETEAAWERWADGYESFVLAWARVAEETETELFSVGVELRSWVTSTHAPRFLELIERVREVYSGPLTYAANWDDAEHSVIWGALDVIGINAFYPLAEREDAHVAELDASSRRLSNELEAWVQGWGKPVLFTEVGYTTRPDPALRPWEWPEDLGNVEYDGDAQAEAYTALLGPFLEREWFLGFFVWRFYADPYDASQEPAWGFSPLHKPAELALRSIFDARWAADAERFRRSPLAKATHRIGAY